MNFCVQVFFVFSNERKSASEKCVKKYTKSPHVYFATFVVASSGNLWRHVGRRTAEDLELFAIFAERCKSKIYELDHVRLIFDKYIIQLYISMSNSSAMQVIKGFSNLLKEPPTNPFPDHS